MNIDDIKKRYLLESDNIFDMRRELIKCISALHPDKSNGRFLDEESENQYKDINEAIQYIDKILKNENHLVPISTVTDLIKIVQDITPKNNETQIRNSVITEQKLYASLETFRKDSLAQGRGFKIASSIFASLISAIWIFPTIINEHPIISQYIETDNILFTLIWLASIFFTSIIWVFHKIKENKIIKITKRLKNEIYQNNLFKSFMRKLSEKNSLCFDKVDLIDFILEKSEIIYYYTKSSVFPSFAKYKQLHNDSANYLDSEIVHEMVNLIIARAEEKKIIKKMDIVSFSDKYEICIK